MAGVDATHGFEAHGPLYCPRCDRAYTTPKGERRIDTVERLKKHVAQQHPDHDPEWFDTYPHSEKDNT